MIRRPLRPSFSHTEEQSLLKSLGDTRDWVIKCCSAADFHSVRRARCEAVNKAIDGAESGWSISTALRAGGYKIAPSTVALHIEKGCRCYGSN